MRNNIYTGSSAQELDRIAIKEYRYLGINLMKLAGKRAFELMQQRFPVPGSLLVVCGKGNNGGDGYVLAQVALEFEWNVDLVATGSPNTDEAKQARQAFVKNGGIVASVESIDAAKHYDVIVDALLGVGISGPPRNGVADILSIINELDGFKLAIDVPTGVDADTGNVYFPNFKADQTITFIVAKMGLLTGPSKDAVGSITCDSLGIKNEIIGKVTPCARLIPPPTFVNRKPDSHKGKFGHVAIVGGDNGMLGAVLLAGKAALRMGSGKVTVVSTEEHLDQPPLFAPELMSSVFDNSSIFNKSMANRYDVIALGPGLGLNNWGRQVFDDIIEQDAALVIDADALTLLAETQLKSNNGNWILTPHPGEAASLLGCDSADIQADRLAAVKEIARSRNSVCVLKGAGTLVASPEGDVQLCPLGNPGMATAGMGDVLTGMIASLLGQGYPSVDAAGTAVWLHAYTADYLLSLACENSLLASDTIDSLAVSIRDRTNRTDKL